MTHGKRRTAKVVAFAALAYLFAPQGVLSLALPPRMVSETPARVADTAPAAYLASPLGFSEAGRSFYEGTLLPLVKETGFTVLDPWKLTPEMLIHDVVALPYGVEKRARWQALNQVIARNNAEAIKKCDLVIAVLDGTDVDSGTAAEIGYAAALGKKIIGYRGDFRRAGDNEGSLVNLQVEYFVRLNGGQVVESVALLRQALVELRRGAGRR